MALLPERPSPLLKSAALAVDLLLFFSGRLSKSGAFILYVGSAPNPSSNSLQSLVDSD
jgi:hypothetical protein